MVLRRSASDPAPAWGGVELGGPTRASDTATPDWATAPWGYVRFHGGSALPPGCYGELSFARWLDRVRVAWPAEADVFLYWNNDHRGCAPHDAAKFASMARRAGLEVTVTPDPETLPVG